MPGATDAVPSVLVMARSAWGVRVSTSVAELLPGLESAVPATVTVLVSEPVALGSIVPVSVMVALWLLARLSPLHTRVPGS